MAMKLIPFACVVALTFGCGDDEDDRATGTWVGEEPGVENLVYASSGSLRIEVVIERADDDRLTGYFVLGEGDPGAPTDPDVGYPDALTYDGSRGYRFVEGFRYALTEREEQPLRDGVRFEFDFLEPWNEWCALQTPIMATEETWKCLPNAGYGVSPRGNCYYSFTEGETTPVDCGKLQLCLVDPICDCNASGCQTMDDPGSAGFDTQGDLADFGAEGTPGFSLSARLNRE